MPPDIKNVLIICKRNHAGAAALGIDLREWLAARGIVGKIAESESIDRGIAADLAVVLGGDGTMLGAARNLAGSGMPILGINFGRVGFLTACDAAAWREGLEAALAGALPLKNCLILRWRVFRAGELFAEGVAVNDVVLSRGSIARVISAQICVNGEQLGILRGDGVIVSSPLGSTGYSVSAAGAILRESLEAISLTPICPFLASAPPMIFAAKDVLELHVTGDAGECFLTIDGQEGLHLRSGDVAQIFGYPCAIKLLGSEARFFERLHALGMWGASLSTGV